MGLSTDRASVLAHLNVSRETTASLDAYVDLLIRWQKKINLVGPKTIDEIWARHIHDSAQLLPFIPRESTILDCGSGAGLPGLILALLGPHRVESVESDARKIAFQRQAAMALGVMEKVVLHNKRLESLSPRNADIITARAFAPLPKLLDLGYAHAHGNTLWILPKGQNVDDELTRATTSWIFDVEKHASQTQDDAVLLLLRHVRPR